MFTFIFCHKSVDFCDCRTKCRRQPDYKLEDLEFCHTTTVYNCVSFWTWSSLYTVDVYQRTAAVINHKDRPVLIPGLVFTVYLYWTSFQHNTVFTLLHQYTVMILSSHYSMSSNRRGRLPFWVRFLSPVPSQGVFLCHSHFRLAHYSKSCTTVVFLVITYISGQHRISIDLWFTQQLFEDGFKKIVNFSGLCVNFFFCFFCTKSTCLRCPR